MSLAKALTNDLERQIRSYRVPIMTALGFSFRLFNEDRFLITDGRETDSRRGIVKLERISQIRRLMTKPGQGVDDRTFIDMGGTLLFNGVPNEDESQIVPTQNVAIVGGRDDALDVVFTHTGTEEDKLAKVRRYTARKPEEINWRIRTPVMMAPETTVIDYLAFRCSKLPFVHSVALKWSNRRWDPRRTDIAEDLYRPEGEDSHMIILAPVWMDESMTRIDPEVWGGYEPIVQFNYSEYLGRRDDEYRQDLYAFDRCYGVYSQIIDSYTQCVLLGQDPGEFLAMTQEEQNRALVGRVQKRLNTVANRTLHIPFDRKLRSGDYTYKSIAYDQTDGEEVTEDVFNFREVDGSITYSSGWLSDTLDLDGWFHFSQGMASRIPAANDPDDQAFFAALPPVTTNFAGEDVQPDHFMRLEGGRIARRLVLPDGRFLFDFWARLPDHDERLSYNVEVIRNTRLATKKAFLNASSRVQTIEHFREGYETVAVARIPSTGGRWEQMSISFKLVDHFFVQNEAYPAHEVFIVITVNEENNLRSPEPEVVPFDMGPMSLWKDEFDHNIELINTAQRYRFSNLLPEQDRLVKLENCFRDDEIFQGIETAFNQCRLDGQNMCVVAEHRLGYNLRQTGTSINTWLKMNSEEEAEQEVLARRGSFALFQKLGTNLAQYTSQVNGDRSVSLQFFSSAIAGVTDGQHSVNSGSYRNHLLDPIVGFTGFDRLNIPWPTVPGLVPNAWPEPSLLDNYRLSFRNTGEQPREWLPTVDGIGMDSVVVPVDALISIGKNKTVRVQSDDPYIAWGGVDGSFSAETWWQDWMDMDDDAWNNGGVYFLPDGTQVTINPGTHVLLWKCLEYHARLAYSYETEDLFQAQNFGFDYTPESQSGFIFAPVSSNRYLLDPPDNYGMYLISPGGWSPRYSPNASPGGLGSPLMWPISPCDWGSDWPRYSPSPFDPSPSGSPSESPYAGIENSFSPWGWNKSGQNLDPLYRTYPVFLGGRIEFDRWFNWSISFDPESVSFSVNGLEVFEHLPPEIDGTVYPFDFNDADPLQKNTADLWIGTTNPDDTNSCSPISLYSFKIFQRAITERETLAIYGDEGINFNDYQYNLYGEYLDHDLDRQIDFWQDDLTDFTLGVLPVDLPYAVSPSTSPNFSPSQSPYLSPASMPFPRDLTKRFGQTVMLSGDTITIPSVVDRDYNIIDDTLDQAYIAELIEIQRNGWSDGLLFWDFYHEDQEPLHGFDTRKFTQCVGYENDRLDYKPWLLERIGTEFNSIRAVTDVIPYLEDVVSSPVSQTASPSSPSGSPADGLTTNWPTWGDDDDELLLTGIKGWFGLSDVMGYRDTLAKIQEEGIIFNYLQAEVRFRADRATLEAHLKDYAQDYDDIFFDRYEGNRLRVAIRQSSTDSAS